MPEIRSSRDPDDPRPWFDFRLRSDLRAVVEDVKGLAAADWSDADETDEQALVEDSPHSLVISREKPEERHVLAVTTDGAIEFVPESEQRPVYYAHLAWYDPLLDEITQLQFIDS
jgi:hypothetical protein